MIGITRYINEAKKGEISKADWFALVSQFAKHRFRFTGVDINLLRLWEDVLTLEQKYLVLKEARFTGFVDEKVLDYSGELNVCGGIMKKGIEEFCDSVCDATYNGWDYSLTWTLGYGEGRVEYIDAFSECAFALQKLTKKQSPKTMRTILKHNVNIRDVLFIRKTYPSTYPIYYVRNWAGIRAYKDYGKFEFWRFGKGEKKRKLPAVGYTYI